MTEALKTIQFNTGRKYTAEGQVITATLYSNGVVTFYDASRMIHGQFSNQASGLLSLPEYRLGEWELALRGAVVSAYDKGDYEPTSRSVGDGMMKGGRNTRDGFDALTRLQKLDTPEQAKAKGGQTALSNLLADMCGSLGFSLASADEVLNEVAATQHGAVGHELSLWLMDFILAWDNLTEPKEEWHVLGDGQVVLEICPTRAAAEDFVHNYTKGGNWGGYGFIHIGNKVTGEAKTFTAPEAEDDEAGGLGVRIDKYPDHLDDGEREVIDALIKAALADGYTIEVQGEGETDLEASTNYVEITDMVAATCETVLVMRKPGVKTFWFQCVHGNSGAEVIADYLVSDAAEALIAKVQPIIDRLEAEGR